MNFNVTTRNGTTHTVEGRVDLSLMQNIRNGGIDELQAICGGSLSCATCHVYVEGVGTELPPRSADEEDLLDASDHLEGNSRLSCQIVFEADLEGMHVTVAPED
jgi:2Fe-2S ferredoxin